MRIMRRCLVRITLALFALRALVPAGYMPDLGALDAGHLEIVLCSAHGDAPSPPQHMPRDDCPFGMVLVKGFVAPVLPVLLLPAAAIDVAFLDNKPAGLRPPSHGPPLGSRAPPALLV
jgi:hypothetical protein